MLHQQIILAPDAQITQRIAEHVVQFFSTYPYPLGVKRPFVVVPSAHVLSAVRAHYLQILGSQHPTKATGLLPFECVTLQDLQQRWQQLEGYSALHTCAVSHVWFVYEALVEQPELRALFGTDPHAWLDAASELITLAQELADANVLSNDHWESALQQLPEKGRTWLSREAQLLLSVAQALYDQQQLGDRAHAIAWAQKQQAAVVWVDDATPPVWIEAMWSALDANIPSLHIQCGDPIFWTGHPWAHTWSPMAPSDSSEDFANSINWRTPDLQYIQGDSFEITALRTVHAVYALLTDNPQQSIALVALDRVLARRVRALLERAQILVDDKTGWSLSTTSSATAIMRLLEALQHNHIETFIDWLRSPFIQWEGILLDSTVLVEDLLQAMEQARIAKQWVHTLAVLTSVAELAHTPHVQRAIHYIGRLAEQSAVSFDEIQTALDMFGISAQLLADRAGCQVLAAWQHMDSLFQGQKKPFSAWRAALHYELEAQRYRPNHIKSPVMMVALSSTRLRHFDAVFLLGADAQHLPSAKQYALFFNDRVRNELGLSTQKERQAVVMRDLARLVSLSKHTYVVWQTMEDARPRALSPWLTPFFEGQFAANSALPMVQIPRDNIRLADITAGQRVQVHLDKTIEFPSSISVSQAEWLLQCPYRFYLTVILKIETLELEVSQEPQRSELGMLLHDLLLHLHQKYPDPRHWPEDLELLDFWNNWVEQRCAQLAKTQPFAYIYALELKRAANAYLQAARQQSATFFAGEQSVACQLTNFPAPVSLKGRIDRVDKHVNGEWQLIDYKWGGKHRSQYLAKNSIQLLLYAYLWQSSNPETAIENIHSSFWAVNRNEVHMVSLSEDMQQEDIVGTLTHTVESMMQQAIFQNEPRTEHCSYCSMSGICRKDFIYA